MVIVMEEIATEEQISGVIDKLVKLGFDIHRSTGVRHTVLGAVGDRTIDWRDIELLDGVKEVLRITSPYKLASKTFKAEPTQIKIRDVTIGGKEVVMMAGPCTVESRDQVMSIAEIVARNGAKVLRGGAFKPRTSPYSFQGLGEEGLKFMRQAADRYDLLVVSEVMEPSQIPLFIRYVDILQIGARNMQNFNLLREVGRINKPVLLKRGPAATIEETLLAAEYIMSGGNHEVIICERGIRTFEPYLRNTFDISAIPVFKKLSHLPVAADPSHATGRRDKVPPVAQAAVAAGADALLIEVHNDPENALCDGAQSLLPDQFEELTRRLRLIALAVDREVAPGVEVAAVR
ncbi:MAG TPA: 3-deoxy-7-phosphoheptulonate synthase [Blastocatellia bacterium]|jgi:3-deoxy-7-phosphoheptulonate synthase|nr:3-deoxy-7-phosphoheptulonate synthase [Blastocatellia bacterium]